MRARAILSVVALGGCRSIFGMHDPLIAGPDDGGAVDVAIVDAPDVDGALIDGKPADAMADARPIDAPVMIDAALDAPMPDAATCQGFTAIAGAPATSRYKIHGYNVNAAMDQSASWNAAKTQCASEGGYLAVLDTQAESTALAAAIPLNPAPASNAYHDGITDAVTEGTWLTIFGATPGYLTWGGGQPNGGTAQNCAASVGPSLSDITCDASDPAHKLAYACECNP